MSAATDAPQLPGEKNALVAVDLGAESCRVSLLRWIDSKPCITLVHRFPNAPVTHADGSLRWPLSTIEAEVDHAMRLCAELAPEGIRAVAIDGWAVDYVRVDRHGRPLAQPYCYRDERTIAAEQHLHVIIPPERLGELTGIQLLRINTLYQLHADHLAGLPVGHRWLNLPEYMLTRWGAEPIAEFTNATHTQLVDLHTRAWNREIFHAAQIDVDHAPRIVPPGTVLGEMQGSLRELPPFHHTQLIAPACHDTASAIAGISGACLSPNDDWAYISSGTWSLVGTLTRRPMNSPAARADNFTNLGAVGGGTCFHRNVNGMWLLKQCMDAWSEARAAWSLDALIEAAARCGPPDASLDVDDPELLLPGHMPGRINTQRHALGLLAIDESPSAAPAMVSLILHSLAARYKEVLTQVQQHSGKSLKRLYIIGGGSRNTLLNRLTSEVTGLQVICGATESSTIGNFAVQLAALESSIPGDTPAFAEEVARWAARIHPLPA